MKKLLLSIIITLTLVSSIFALDGLEYFSGRSENGYILLEWKINSQENIESFYIMKKRSNDTEYNNIHRIDSDGPGSYSYKDERLYKTSGLSFKYKLKIVFADQPFACSDWIEVDMNISGVNQTWGSIKAMFR
ncbi:MAG: hypothetical protein PF551_04990 [Candidatus Marinimicrobia bacterium]|nr:hypothetical protein [Candidatus Neomarinimicrobiota bacterium]